MSIETLAEYRFSVTNAPASAGNGDDVAATIVCEPLTDDPHAASCGAFAVRLKPGTSAADAREMARYLQLHVKGFCHLEADAP